MLNIHIFYFLVISCSSYRMGFGFISDGTVQEARRKNNWFFACQKSRDEENLWKILDNLEWKFLFLVNGVGTHAITYL